jgi:hypothetical protein
MIYILGGLQCDSIRFHHTILNIMQFQAYELFNFEIFHLISLDHGWPWVIETTDKGSLLYCQELVT